MAKKSAGLLFYRFHKKKLEILLVHPGGPFWTKKDSGAWSIPKGEVEEAEDPFTTALREVREETGIRAEGNFIELTPIKQKTGKIVYAWAIEADVNADNIVSNTFEIEWTPKSGVKKTFPEIDKAAWFTMEEAAIKLLEAQLPLLNELQIVIQ